MEKRIFIAVVISIALLYGWAVVAPKLFPELAKPPKPATTTAATTTTTTATTTTSTVPAPATKPAEVEPAVPLTPVSAAAAVQTTVDTPELTARFSNRGAELVSFQLKHYHE